jgi:hypothetical protein
MLLHVMCAVEYRQRRLHTDAFAVCCCGTCSDDKHRASYSLMAHYALLSDPMSCGKLVANKRLASGLLSVVATRGAKDSRWVSMCW